ncbi:MAG: metallophosphoesterase family protein, partial [Polyangiaceae bacterium]
TVDELMMADGTTHPSELAFRSELARLLDEPIALVDEELETLESGTVVIAEEKAIAPAQPNHPFFARSEWDYARDKETFAAQAAADLELVRQTMARLEEDRRRGAGKLKLGSTFADFAQDKPFADGHVIVHPPGSEDHDLLVLGDLHGCYSCLKAALLQADFFNKVQAYHDDPEKHPNMLLVLLGDYIDRGRFSYSGILRTVMQLYLTVPEHVVPLRGNHEYYVELNNRVYSAVKPSEAMASLKDLATNEVFSAYMRLFEALPCMFVFDKLFFVHAGIPRDDTFAEKWQGLESLNEFDLRFQMLWSDPSQADTIPVDLQKQSARFPFGKRQFRSFMQKIGCTTMIRGHERIVDGFKEVYADPDARLLNLFSAGGEHNNDLPADSNYREVKPKALTIKYRGGVAEIVPWEIDYAKYNSAETNAFFREAMDAAKSPRPVG